ncbi:hypothetical protein EGW08_021189 [Elysia chlorotica]|uniref:Uncharacterized protein n=1 Tax=Elysia chlorotica TaxID=188477 RepID=A0A433SP91_ELYCH|nr:hypothetical protein EGW08_021189 [Elysia chlorotica]
MKCALVFAAVVAVCLAANSHHLADLVHKEVSTLYNANTHITYDACVHKCDSLFDFVDATDESETDRLCAEYCRCLGQFNTVNNPTQFDFKAF